MRKFIFLIFYIFILFSKPLIATEPPINSIERDISIPPQTVKLNLSWIYNNFPLKFRLFELSPKSKQSLWKTKNTKNFQQELSILSEIKNGNIEISANSFKVFAMVLENNSNKDLYFYASPHIQSPPDETIGLKVFCLCYGDVHKVAAKSQWYRIIQFSILPNNRGSEFSVVHSIFGTDEKNKLKGDEALKL